MTTRPEPARLDTVRGTTRQIIGLAKSLALKAVGDPDLTSEQGGEALEVVGLLLSTYQGLVQVGRSDRPISTILSQFSEAEQADYKYVRHAIRILRGLYGPKAEDR